MGAILKKSESYHLHSLRCIKKNSANARDPFSSLYPRQADEMNHSLVLIPCDPKHYTDVSSPQNSKGIIRYKYLVAGDFLTKLKSYQLQLNKERTFRHIPY